MLCVFLPRKRRREPLFRALDPIVIDVDAIDPDTAVAQAIEALGRHRDSASIAP